MNATKLGVILLAVIGLVVFFWPNRYETSVYFHGKELQHAESVDRGSLTSYFYTPSGGEPGASDEFIQLVVFDKGATDEFRQAIYKQTANLFHLKPLNDAGDTLLGTVEGEGEKVYVYANQDERFAPHSLILYVVADAAELPEAKAKADDYLAGLRDIQATLN
jgi:hypothetical protein